MDANKKDWAAATDDEINVKLAELLGYPNIDADGRFMRKSCFDPGPS